MLVVSKNVVDLMGMVMGYLIYATTAQKSSIATKKMGMKMELVIYVILVQLTPTQIKTPVFVANDHRT